MMRWIYDNFKMYDEVTDEADRWEQTQKLVDLCMMVLAGMSLLVWGIR